MFEQKCRDRDFDDELVKEALYYLGMSRLEELQFKPVKIRKELDTLKKIITHREDIREDILFAMDDEGNVTLADVKKLLKSLYKEFEIPRTARGFDIYFYFAPSEIQETNNKKRGYKFTPSVFKHLELKVHQRGMTSTDFYNKIVRAKYKYKYNEEPNNVVVLKEDFYAMDYLYLDVEYIAKTVSNGFNLYYAIN